MHTSVKNCLARRAQELHFPGLVMRAKEATTLITQRQGSVHTWIKEQSGGSKKHECSITSLYLEIKAAPEHLYTDASSYMNKIRERAMACKGALQGKNQENKIFHHTTP